MTRTHQIDDPTVEDEEVGQEEDHIEEIFKQLWSIPKFPEKPRVPGPSNGDLFV
jgi:hypothetical protein